MHSAILNAYRFHGVLPRIPFALSFLGLSSLIEAISFSLRYSFMSAGVDAFTLASIVWGMKMLGAILVLPLCAARLRDIGWPSVQAFLIVLLPALSPIPALLIAYKVGGTLSLTHWAFDVTAVLVIPLLVWLLLLFAIRGEDSAT